MQLKHRGSLMRFLRTSRVRLCSDKSFSSLPQPTVTSNALPQLTKKMCSR